MTRLSICLSLTVALSSGAAIAAPSKPAAEAADKAKAASGPAAEMEKLKGAYKWGMTSEEVVAKVQDNVRAAFDERLKKTTNDPTRQDRVRKEM
ncbi:MAG TPA: hypothetical protein VGG33_20910, partial [Polyangia bacterium]